MKKCTTNNFLTRFALTLFLGIGAVTVSFAQAKPNDIIFKDDFNNANSIDNWHKNIKGWETTNLGPKGQKELLNVRLNNDGDWMMFDAYAADPQGAFALDERLISPAFSCVMNNQVYLKFKNHYRKGTDYDNLTDHISVQISTDSLTWNEILIYEDLLPLEFPSKRQTPIKVNNYYTQILNISNFAANKPKVWLAFRYQKEKNVEGFGWQIDDVEIWNNDPKSLCDVAISDDFYSITPNAMMPAFAAESISFLARYENHSATKLQNVKAEIKIANESTGKIIFTDELIINNFEKSQIIDNQIFNKNFRPSEEGRFIGEYRITPNCLDNNPNDNFARFQFQISDSTISKELSNKGSTIISPSEVNPNDPKWEYGIHIFLPKGKGYRASSMSFRATSFNYLNSRDPRLIIEDEANVKLYRWDNSNNDEYAQPSELSLVGKNTYTFEKEFGTFTVPLYPIVPNPKGVLLEDSTHYLAVVEYVPLNGSESGLAFFSNDTMFYQANEKIGTLLGKNNFTTALKANNEVDFNMIGFNYAMVPIIRLNVQDAMIAVNNIIDAPQVHLYPNPTQNTLNINAQNIDFQDIMIYNQLGQAVAKMPYQSQISLEALPEGVYQVFLRKQDNNAVLRTITKQK